MRFTYVDSASVNSLVHLFTVGSVERLDKWTIESAQEITTAMLLTDALTLLPSPEPREPSYGRYGLLRRELATQVFDGEEINDLTTRAFRKTKRWAYDNQAVLSATFAEIFDSDDCGDWLEKEKQRIWVHHSRTRRGLFNRSFAREIGAILGVRNDDVESLHGLSCNQEEIARHISGREQGEEFRTIEKAYVLSALLRGIYQDYFARGSRHSIVQHPLRRDARFFPHVVDREILTFRIANTMCLLGGAIVNSSLLERRPSRMKQYSAYMRRAREAILQESIDVSRKSTMNAAVDAALEGARRLGIRTHPRIFYDFIDIGIGLGVGAITSFTLSPYSAFALGAAATVLSRSKSVGDRFGGALDTKKRIAALFEGSPGRIGSSWSTE